MPYLIKVHRVVKYNTDGKAHGPFKVVFKDKFERNKVVRKASNIKEAETCYKNVI